MVKTSFLQKISLVLFGIFISLIFIEFILRISGLIYYSFQNINNRPDNQSKEEYRILCIGESTTALGKEGSYPAQLEEILNKKYPHKKVKVINEGISGITSTGILSRLEENLRKYSPRMVISMMGINDLLMYSYMGSNDDKDFLLEINNKILDKLKTLKLFFLIIKSTDVIYKDFALGKISEINKAKLFLERGWLKDSENILEKMILKNENNLEALLLLGKIYFIERKYEQARKIFGKAIEIEPTNSQSYKYLAFMMFIDGKSDLAFDLLKRSVNGKFPDADVYALLSGLSMGENDILNAEEFLKKALEKDGAFFVNIYMLCNLVEIRQDYNKTIELIQKNIVIGKNEVISYSALALIYENLKDESLNRKYLKMIDDISKDFFLPVTVNNYVEMAHILKVRNIQLVVVQYPLKKIDVLQKTLGGNNGVVFVDNEKVFKKGLKIFKYDKLFIDKFAGEFGHATTLGNRLLAWNIARVIEGQLDE